MNKVNAELATNNVETNRTLPNGWRWVKVGEICERIEYGYTASADFSIQEPKFLRITDIQNGSVDWQLVPGCKISIAEEAANKLRDGDIVFARTGGTTGKSFLIKAAPRAVFASYLIRLSPSTLTTPDYLYAFFQSNEYWKQIRANARGGAQPNVNATLLSQLVLPLPPLPEQKRIAAILNEQMAAVEKARAAAEAQLEAAKTLPAAYLRSVFNSPEAKGWRWMKLGEVCVQDRQIIEPSSGIALKLPYLSLEHVESCSGKILKQPSGVIEDEGLSTTFAFDARHLLYGKLRPYLNKVAMPDFPGRCTTELIPLLPNSGIQRGYLCWILRRQKTVNEAMRGKTGSRMPRASMEDLFQLLIPLPPLPEQKRIATTLNEQIASAEKLSKHIDEQLNTIKKLPASLLKRAFEGGL